MNETVRLPRDLEAEARAEAARIEDEEAQTIMEAARDVFGIGVERVSEGDPPRPPPPSDWNVIDRGPMDNGVIPWPSWREVAVALSIFALILAWAVF